MIGFPGGSDNKESSCNAGDPGLIPGLGRLPLEKETVTHSSIVRGIAELDTTEGLHTFLCELSLSVTEEIRENWREVERKQKRDTDMEMKIGVKSDTPPLPPSIPACTANRRKSQGEEETW